MAPSSKQAARSADTGTSVRARSRHDPQDPTRKTVYKPVLANPLTIDWPPLPASVRRSILDHLLAVLASSTTDSGKSISDWRLDEHAHRRGNSRRNLAGPDTKSDTKGDRKANSASTKSSADNNKATAPTDATHTLTTRSSSTYSIPSSQPHPPPSAAPTEPAPPILSHLVLGINEVTRALETRIRWGRWELGDCDAKPSSSLSLPPPPEPRPGRHRRRKSSSAKGQDQGAAPPVIRDEPARPAPQPLALADHPAYGFLRSRHAPPKPALDRRPPYVVVVKGGQGGRGVQRERSVRLLVNSDARRVGGKAARATRDKVDEGTLLPTQPGAPAPAVDFDGDDVMVTDDEPSAPSPAPAPAPAPALAPPPPPTVPLIDLVLVCRPDINPPSLVAHLPTMVAAANGVQSALDGVLAGTANEEKEGEGDAAMQDGKGKKQKKGSARPEMRCVRLVQLDVGAERKLADALGLRRVAVIGLSSLAPGTGPLLDLIASHLPEPLSAPWLVPHLLHPPSSSSTTTPTTTAPTSRFAPTAIKHLKTSAPLNPRAAVVEKKDARRRKREDKAERLGKRRRGEGGGSGSASEVYLAED
ncbi:hypothetical protein JCM8208_002231 [Rhodotorula glutinis]